MNTIDINTLKLSDNAVIPAKTYDDDFCYDMVATSCEEISPGVYKYGFGLAFEIDDQVIKRAKEENLLLSIDIRPRSSIYKTGMILSNSTGTVDQLYRGEVSAIFYHVFPTMPKYEVGDRVAQCKIGFTLPINFKEVASIRETSRGSGGYGSTGK